MTDLPNISLYTEDLSPDMQNAAYTMAERLDFSSPDGILNMGVETLGRMSAVSTELVDVASHTDLDSALNDITTVAKHVSRFGRMLHGGKALSKAKSKSRILDRYHVLKIELNRISAKLDGQRRNLIRSISLLEDTHAINLEIYQELGVILEAGKIKSQQINSNDSSSDSARRLDLKIRDITTSRLVCRQTAVQIFLLRDAAISLLDRLNSINDTVIPLWSTQVALALGVNSVTGNQLSSANAYSAISEATKALSSEFDSTNKLIQETHNTVGGIRP